MGLSSVPLRTLTITRCSRRCQCMSCYFCWFQPIHALLVGCLGWHKVRHHIITFRPITFDSILFVRHILIFRVLWARGKLTVDLGTFVIPHHIVRSIVEVFPCPIKLFTFVDFSYQLAIGAAFRNVHPSDVQHLRIRIPFVCLQAV